MGVDKPGWYYVGNGQLRYMDGDGWTDQYKAIDDPYTTTNDPPVRAGLLNSEPTNSGSPSPATANKPPNVTKPHRRASPLVIAFCVGLVGVGGGLLRPDVFHGATSWAAEQAGQISALISPPAPTAQAIAAKPVVKPKVKAKVPAKTKASAPKLAAPRPTATGLAVRPAAPAPAAPIQPKPNPGWDGRGYTKADYADRVGDIPIWIGKVRFALDAGYELTTYTDLAGLGHRFNEVGMLPAPPGVDPGWWTVETATLSQFSQQAADNWDNGDQTTAIAGFEVVVKESNTLVTKVNKAFGLHVALS